LKFAAKIREAIVKRANKRGVNSNLPRNMSREQLLQNDQLSNGQ
jgi:hypothetical protein